jgi:hypothetical protein
MCWATARGPRVERLAAQSVFLQKRGDIWKVIQNGKFPVAYVSAYRKKLVGAPLRDGDPM